MSKSTFEYRLEKDWFDVVNNVLMIVLAFFAIFPMYYVVLISLADYASFLSSD